MSPDMGHTYLVKSCRIAPAFCLNLASWQSFWISERSIRNLSITLLSSPPKVTQNKRCDFMSQSRSLRAASTEKPALGNNRIKIRVKILLSELVNIGILLLKIRKPFSIFTSSCSEIIAALFETAVLKNSIFIQKSPFGVFGSFRQSSHFVKQQTSYSIFNALTLSCF